MYRAYVPAVVRAALPRLTWCMPPEPRAVYLTFDDGPTPAVTPWVLDQLAAAHAQATFFCLGRHEATHQALFDRIKAEGHAIGNHTWDHTDGWKTSARGYLRNVLRCQSLTGTEIFRPPYGHITPGQARALSTRFQVVMWDVLSADFDTAIDGAQCVHNVVTHVRPGSVVVFHDSVKAWPRLSEALPQVLDALATAGYRMRALPEQRAGFSPPYR